MRYQGRRAKSAIDWDTIDFVVGTRADVTGTGINRPCSKCGHPVFTSRSYPERVSMVCEHCALEIAREQEATDAAPDVRVTGAAKRPVASLLDPWGRAVRASGKPRRTGRGRASRPSAGGEGAPAGG